MFDNIGGKLKGLAQVLFWIEAIAAVIFGFVALPSGAIIIVLGVLIALVSSWFVYGFGELIETTAINAENTAEMLEIMRRSFEKDRIMKLDRMLDQGLISDEEYKKALFDERSDK